MAIALTVDVCPSGTNLVIRANDGGTPVKLDWTTGTLGLQWGADGTEAAAMTPVDLVATARKVRLDRSANFDDWYAQMILLTDAAERAAMAANPVVLLTHATGDFVSGSTDITGATVTAVNHAEAGTEIWDDGDWSDIPEGAADDLENWSNGPERIDYSGHFVTQDLLQQVMVGPISTAPWWLTANDNGFPSTLNATVPIYTGWRKAPTEEIWITWKGGDTLGFTSGATEIGSQDTIGAFKRRRYMTNGAATLKLTLTALGASRITEAHVFRATNSAGDGTTNGVLDPSYVTRSQYTQGKRLMNWLEVLGSNVLDERHITPETWYGSSVKFAAETVGVSSVTAYANSENWFWSKSATTTGTVLLVETDAPHSYGNGQQVKLDGFTTLTVNGISQSGRSSMIFVIDSTHFVWLANTTGSLVTTDDGSAVCHVKYLPKASVVAAWLNELACNRLDLCKPPPMTKTGWQAYIAAVWDALTPAKKAVAVLGIEDGDEKWQGSTTYTGGLQAWYGWDGLGFANKITYEAWGNKQAHDGAMDAVVAAGGSPAQVVRVVGYQAANANQPIVLNNAMIAVGGEYEELAGAPYMDTNLVPDSDYNVVVIDGENVSVLIGPGIFSTLDVIGESGFVTLIYVNEYSRWHAKWSAANAAVLALGKIHSCYEGGWQIIANTWPDAYRDIFARAHKHPRAASHLIHFMNRLRTAGYSAFNWFQDMNRATTGGFGFQWGQYEVFDQVASRGDGMDGATDNVAAMGSVTWLDTADLDSVLAQATDEWGATFGGAAPAVSITNAADLGTVYTGSPLGITFTATGGTGPKTWTVTAGTFPTGSTLSPDGTTSGNLTTADTFIFTLQADDGDTTPATREFTVIVADTPVPTPALTIQTTNLPHFTEGVADSTIITCTGGVGDFTYRDDETELPAGLTLTETNSTGLCVLTYDGTTAAGSYGFTFGVSDSDDPAADATQALTVVIDPAPIAAEPVPKMKILSIDFTGTIVGTLTVKQVEAENAAEPVAYYADQGIRCSVGTTSFAGGGGTWADVTDGALKITVGGTSYTINPSGGSGFNFSTVQSQADALGRQAMDVLAAMFEASIRLVLKSAEVAGWLIHVEWDEDNRQMVFGRDARYTDDITAITAPASGTDLSAAGYLNAAAAEAIPEFPNYVDLTTDGYVSIAATETGAISIPIRGVDDALESVSRIYDLYADWSGPSSFAVYDTILTGTGKPDAAGMAALGFNTAVKIMYMQNVYTAPGTTDREGLPTESVFKEWITTNCADGDLLILDFEATVVDGVPTAALVWGLFDAIVDDPQAIEYRLTIQRWAKEANPTLIVTQFGLWPKLHHTAWALQSGATWDIIEAGFTAGADLWQAMDCACPSFYPRFTNEIDGRIDSIAPAIAAWKDLYPFKPVLPFHWWSYHTNDFVDRVRHQSMLAQIVAHADGVVAWGKPGEWPYAWNAGYVDDILSAANISWLRVYGFSRNPNSRMATGYAYRRSLIR